MADYIVNELDRKLMGYFATRDGKTVTSPTAGIFGPKVMIINESAGSGGDALPYMFKQRKIGPLVGTRTWGGLVGTLGVPPTIDGGGITAPRLAFYDLNGKWAVENEGITPDIEVEYTAAEVIKGHDPQLERAVQEAHEAARAESREARAAAGADRSRVEEELRIEGVRVRGQRNDSDPGLVTPILNRRTPTAGRDSACPSSAGDGESVEISRHVANQDTAVRQRPRPIVQMRLERPGSLLRLHFPLADLDFLVDVEDARHLEHEPRLRQRLLDCASGLGVPAPPDRRRSRPRDPRRFVTRGAARAPTTESTAGAGRGRARNRSTALQSPVERDAQNLVGARFDPLNFRLSIIVPSPQSRSRLIRESQDLTRITQIARIAPRALTPRTPEGLILFL